MKITNLLGIALSASFLAACSGGGGSSNGDAAKPADAQDHRADKCLSFSGEYFLVGSSSSKTIQTTPVQNGIQLNDTGTNWVIDGKSHPAEGAPNFFYVGTCSQYVISLDLYQGSSLLGKIEYSWNDQGQLVVEMKSNDSRMGESGKDIYESRSH